MRIGVDLMGSDSAPSCLLEAAIEAADSLGTDVNLVLLGSPELEESVTQAGFEFVSASQVIAMEEAPLRAVRRKKQASLMVAMRMVRDGQLDGLVSAGNTGAMILSSAFYLDLLPGASRPALLASMPSLSGSVAVVDIGGNVTAKPPHLVEFARMGAAFQQCQEGIKEPKVGLLNIGTESVKGTEGVQEAYNLLSETADEPFTFVGNVEGREAFSGAVDVVVADGFSGNVFLKTAEGIALFILEHLRSQFEQPLSDEVEKALASLNSRVNYAEYPGAIVCGVGGIIVKCHGFSSVRAMSNGIKGAARLAQAGFIDKMKAALIS